MESGSVSTYQLKQKRGWWLLREEWYFWKNQHVKDEVFVTWHTRQETSEVFKPSPLWLQVCLVSTRTPGRDETGQEIWENTWIKRVRGKIRGLGHKGRTKEGGSQNIQTLIDSLFCVFFFLTEMDFSNREKLLCINQCIIKMHWDRVMALALWKFTSLAPFLVSSHFLV